MALYIVLCIIAVAAGISGALRWRFITRLERLEQRLAAHRSPLVARTDLPPEVVALAERQGAYGAALAPVASFTQTGVMRSSPQAREMRFTARQTIAASEPGFVWLAEFAPLGLTLVADYFVAGIGGLEARLAGVFPLVKPASGDATAKGELMRYLGELPWHPDAILANPALEWEVVDQDTIKVAAGTGAARAEVTYHLDADGFVGSVEASDRPQIANGVAVERPWRGRFWDYRYTGGHIVPARAEVAWVLDDGEFVYWKGTIENWNPAPLLTQ